jgi:hypothetical protein
VATLFEVIDFVQDSKKESVTSGSCKWVKRAKGNEDPILIPELETSYVRETGTFQKTSGFCPLKFEFSVYLLSPYFSLFSLLQCCQEYMQMHDS